MSATETFPAREAPRRNLKSDMLLAATRTFTETGRPDRATCDQFREAFYLLIGQADAQTRQKVATLVSRSPFCPRPIALYLAMDVPSVAMEILRHSPVLGLLDMSQVVRKRGAVHARLLATRADLPPSVVTLMRALDDADVTAALAANRAVQGAARIGTARAAPVESHAKPAMHKTAEAQSAVETKDATAEETPTTANADASGGARALEQRLVNALGAQRAPRRVAPQPLGAAAFRKAFEAAALSRDRSAMARAMRARLTLSHATAMQVLDDHSGNALLVLMKAEGFPADMAHRIVLLALPAVGLSPDAAERVLRTWERLEDASCQAAVAQWPRAEARPVPQTEDAPGARRDGARTAASAASRDEMRRTG